MKTTSDGTLRSYSFANDPSRVPPKVHKEAQCSTTTVGFRTTLTGRLPR
jgi:hypothetical protein